MSDTRQDTIDGLYLGHLILSQSALPAFQNAGEVLYQLADGLWRSPSFREEGQGITVLKNAETPHLSSHTLELLGTYDSLNRLMAFYVSVGHTQLLNGEDSLERRHLASKVEGLENAMSWLAKVHSAAQEAGYIIPTRSFHQALHGREAMEQPILVAAS